MAEGHYSAGVSGAGAALFGRQAHVARRHDRGNRVLVDHLADAVLQQHHELVKGIDLTLQLDAVDEVDRDGHPLFAQGIQKGVLQRLAFGHRVLLILYGFMYGRIAIRSRQRATNQASKTGL